MAPSPDNSEDAGSGTQKRRRDYLRVPSDIVAEVEQLAARWDVPVRSATRMLLSIGLEAIRMHPERARELLAQPPSPPSPPPQEVRASAAFVTEAAVV